MRWWHDGVVAIERAANSGTSKGTSASSEACIASCVHPPWHDGDRSLRNSSLANYYYDVVASASENWNANCGMSIRRRRNPASATGSDANIRQDNQPVQPIDENEQDKIVKNLRANTIQITNELCNVVVLACIGAGALTVIFPLMIAYADSSSTDEEPNDDNNNHQSLPGVSHLIYTTISCLSHCVMAYIAHISKFPLRWNPSHPVRSASTHSGLYASAVASVVSLGLLVGYLNWNSLGGGTSSVDPVTIRSDLRSNATATTDSEWPSTKPRWRNKSWPGVSPDAVEDADRLAPDR